MTFRPIANARSDERPGTLYAINGGASWIYYGQYAPDGSIGFFRFRTKQLANASDVLLHPLMTRISMYRTTSGRAMREGVWYKMGRQPIHSDLVKEPLTVQWPVGTLDVHVWRGGDVLYDTRVEDARIQQLEVIAVWDWMHLPDRLVADFGAELAPWYVGGPIWRARLVKQERAKRSPDDPSEQLPPDWVPVEQ